MALITGVKSTCSNNIGTVFDITILAESIVSSDEFNSIAVATTVDPIVVAIRVIFSISRLILSDRILIVTDFFFLNSFVLKVNSNCCLCW